MPHRDGTLKAREFLFYTEDLAMAGLPADFPRPERKVMWTVLQLHFGDPNVHFELQPQMSRGVVELGLHLEGPVEVNDRWAEYLASNAGQVLCELGPLWELEVWTTSWRRLHRTFRFAQLTTDLGREVAAEFVKALQCLHPLIEAGPTAALAAAVKRA